ncbi:hypothetical protein V6Z11_D02G164500 [Gossypium hirsutum]
MMLLVQLHLIIAIVTLGEEFYLGGVGVTLNTACKICETCRVVGAALIITGLYLVILGKS